MNWLKKLMLFRLLILLIYLEKQTITQKLTKIEKKIPNHDIYITTQFEKLT